MTIEDIKEDVKEILSERRFKHSVGTMKTAKELAHIYGENEQDAELAGLIHDVAKEFTRGEIEDYAKAHKIKIDEVEQKQISLMHAKIGANIARARYRANIKVQRAVLYHTTGNRAMDTFAKIIYVADKIEENRNYDEVETVRKLAKENLDEAILFIIDFNLQKAIKGRTLIHPDTLDLRNYILLQEKQKN